MYYVKVKNIGEKSFYGAEQLAFTRKDGLVQFLAAIVESAGLPAGITVEFGVDDDVKYQWDSILSSVDKERYPNFEWYKVGQAKTMWHRATDKLFLSYKKMCESRKLDWNKRKNRDEWLRYKGWFDQYYEAPDVSRAVEEEQRKAEIKLGGLEFGGE